MFRRASEQQSASQSVSQVLHEPVAGEGQLECAVSHELTMMSSWGGAVMERSCDTPGTFVVVGGGREAVSVLLLTSTCNFRIKVLF